MSSYKYLSPLYDSFNSDVNYNDFADFYESLFYDYNIHVESVLDLCCGTGTLSNIMVDRGYDLIAVDGSVEMLSEAYSKYPDKGILFLAQQAEDLDLYGTVNACYSSLDSINYLSINSLIKTLKRLHLFIEPGGIFIFDIRSPDFLKNLDGQIFVNETDNCICIWRAELDDIPQSIHFGMDIFTAKGELWQRNQEEHIEYIYELKYLKNILQTNGYGQIKIFEDVIPGQKGRVFLSCIRI